MTGVICGEDIVLLKRRLLAKAGWPLNVLLITVVEDPDAANNRHAVLTVRTDRGEFAIGYRPRQSLARTRAPGTAIGT